VALKFQGTVKKISKVFTKNKVINLNSIEAKKLALSLQFTTIELNRLLIDLPTSPINEVT
jgi:hypothetical protein